MLQQVFQQRVAAGPGPGIYQQRHGIQRVEAKEAAHQVAAGVERPTEEVGGEDEAAQHEEEVDPGMGKSQQAEIESVRGAIVREHDEHSGGAAEQFNRPLAGVANG